MEEQYSITSTDYWFKVVEFLQQNWGVIENIDNKCIVYFFGDTAGIFDQIEFNSPTEAEEALRRNGFRKYDEDKKAQEFIGKPSPPFSYRPHPNGAIYSSGRYWK